MDLLEMAEAINEKLPDGARRLGPRYVYDTLFLGIQRIKKAGETTLPLERAALNSIAIYLGYEGIEELISRYHPLVDPVLMAIKGNWYSIVRCNSGLERLLISPVQVTFKNQTGIIELKGPHRQYIGEMKWVAGSFSAHLTSTDGIKSIYLAFRVGVTKNPQILKGVFASISTGGTPIAGRELLWRSDKLFTEMDNHIVELYKKSNPPIQLPISVQHYFSDFSKNYIRIDQASGFNTDDLIPG